MERKKVGGGGAYRTCRGLIAVSGLIVLTVAGGCGTGVSVPRAPVTPVNPDPDEIVDGNRDTSVTSALGKTSGEPNDTFGSPIVAVFDANGVARLQGTVSASGDLDVFLLGTMSPGVRIIVDADTDADASLLDVSIAVFDGAERLVAANDDRSTQDFDSYVEFITRHAGDPYFLVVTHSAFSPSGRGIGSYRVDVELQGGFDVPEPVGQVLLLDFDGGTIESPVLGFMTIKPFDAGAISHHYEGQDQRLRELIRATVEQNYERFNVTVLTSDDPPPPAGTEFSTIYFGGFNPAAFGVAEAVDLYNADYCDDAIIYAESFGPAVFTGVPTTAELAVAIANVASHEAGHLLGLNHVSDDRALMDDRSPADAFIDDQEFMEAPLSSDIMLIGTQDAVLLLDEIVGPSAPGTP